MIYAFKSIDHDHFLLSRVGDLGECNSQQRCDNDVIHHIQYYILRYAVFCQDECTQHKKGKDCIDTSHKCCHRHTEHQGIICCPFSEVVYHFFKSSERMHRLPENLYHWHSPNIFRCFTAHIFKGVLVLRHFLLHSLAHHAHHKAESDECRYHTDQSQLPVEHCQKNEQPHRCSSGNCLVRQIMSNEGFGGCGRVIYNTSDLTCAVLIKYTERQCKYPAHKTASHICLYTKCRDMRTKQSRNVYQKRQDSNADSLPCDIFDL